MSSFFPVSPPSRWALQTLGGGVLLLLGLPTVASAACVVTLRQPLPGAVAEQAPVFRWTVTGDCVQYRVSISPDPSFPLGNREMTGWQTERIYTYPAATWQVTAPVYADTGVYWRVQGEDSTGLRTWTLRRYLGVDPDLDGDGISWGEGDCDDADPGTWPGAEETCDGVDQDCSGVADNDPVDGTPWYPDGDGDGYGEEGGEVWACEGPLGMVGTAGDCDDADFTASPGEEEFCDGVDSDCDGTVDDGLACVNCTPTVPSGAGPNYLADAPYTTDLRDPSQVGADLWMYGKIRTTGCDPMAGVTLDVWQAGAEEGYDFDLPYYYRGKIVTSANGTYAFLTHHPRQEYGAGGAIPYHIHFTFTGTGIRTLTTEMLFLGDAALVGDESETQMTEAISDGMGGYTARWDAVVRPM